MDAFAQIAEEIIKEQEHIIGPLAVEQAEKVSGLKVDKASHKVSFSGNKTTILDHLVGQYKNIFGQTSVEVCRGAAGPFLSKLPPQEVPSLLR
jgi:hypothetical protein